MMHYANIRRAFFFPLPTCVVSEENFGSWFSLNRVCIQHSGARSSPLAFLKAGLWCLGVWAVTAGRACSRQGVVSPLSALQIQALSRVSNWYPRSRLRSLPAHPGLPTLPTLLQGIPLWLMTSQISSLTLSYSTEASTW